MTAATPGRELLDQCWSDLVEMTDRTSPEEYPDMCLITREELGDFLRLAAKPASSAPQLSELDAASNALLELCSRHGFATGHGDTVADIVREVDAQISERLAAKPADEAREPDIFGIAVHALTVGAPGIGPSIRDGIARSISMRVKAASTTGEPKR